MTAVFGILLGLAAGALSGLLGIGGGLVIVPVLMLTGMPIRVASGSSLAALLAPVAIFGVLEYARRAEVRWGLAAFIAMGLVAGVYLGAKLAGRIPSSMLQRGFGVLMVIAGLRFLIVAGK